MVLWVVLRIHNDEDAEAEDSQHGQDGLDHRDKLVCEAGVMELLKEYFY